jgi:hypothetical protein
VWNEETSTSKSVAAIRSVTARGLVVPISQPVKNAFGSIDAPEFQFPTRGVTPIYSLER